MLCKSQHLSAIIAAWLPPFYVDCYLSKSTLASIFHLLLNNSTILCSHEGPISTSRQNRICPWQNPRTNFVVTIFVSSVASTLTWLKSSNCAVRWQLACLKNCSILKAFPCNMWIAKLVIVRGDVTAPQRIRLFVQLAITASYPLYKKTEFCAVVWFKFHEAL